MEEPNPSVYAFDTFADSKLPGSFHNNIKAFLNGEREAFSVEGMTTWCFLLTKNNSQVPLYIIEENVESLKKTLCNHCLYMGWSDNFVSKRRYRFIVPIEAEWEDASYPSERGTHLLHGLIHCNGFGHLISINGIESGHSSIPGREIMDLWDRICTMLVARKIALRDMSMKRSMDIRLLYGIAFGSSWFDRWEYTFCHGTYGVTHDQYKAALAALSSLNLDQVAKDFSDAQGHIKEIIDDYRHVCPMKLITVGDLLRFMLICTNRTPHQVKSIMTGQVKRGISRASAKYRWSTWKRDEATHVYNDIVNFYEHVLLNRPESDFLGKDVRIILNSVHFVKEWPVKSEMDGLLRYLCIIPAIPEGLESRSTPPGELLVVIQPDATIKDLIRTAQEAFRDVYFTMDRFIVTELIGGDGTLYSSKQDEVVSSNIIQGTQILIQGIGLDLDNELMYERGKKNWVVDCICGAKDDDGEKMVSCVGCRVWQHTKCVDWVIEEPESGSRTSESGSGGSDSDLDNGYHCPKCVRVVETE